MRRLLALCCVLICISAPLHADFHAPDMTLTANQMRQLALNAHLKGADTLTLEVTKALLTRDPDDYTALILQARAARNLNQLDLAETAIKRAWRTSDTSGQRYQAALVRAQILSSQGRKTSAQVWLRTAIQNAPSEAAKRAAIRDFRYLRAVNPLRFDIDMKLAKSSNINNGSSQEIYELYGIPFVLQGASLALSGTELSTGLHMTFGVETGQVGRSYGVSLATRDYWMSGAAKVIAPTATGSDFAYRNLQFSHARAWRTQAGHFDQLTFGLGRSWYGAAPLADIGDVRFTRRFARKRKNPLSFGTSLQRQSRLENSTDSTNRLGFELRGSLPIADAGRLSWWGVARKTWSQSPSKNSVSWSLGTSYQFKKPLLTAQASAFAQIGASDYDPVSAFFEPRSDRQTTLGLSLTFPEQALYGFAPTIDFVQSDTRSNDARYDTKSLQITVGLRSAF